MFALTLSVFIFSAPTQVALAPSAHASATPIAPDVVEVVPVAPEECNCWLYVKSQIPSFPNTKNMKISTGTSHNGDVIIFDYPHYAIQVNSNEDGFWVKDSNWGGCGYRVHFFRWGDPHIEGFWVAGDSS